MNKKILKFIALMLVLFGNFVSCKDNASEDDNANIDPEEAILGKWELVLLTRNSGSDEQKYTPTGYFEYLPDSLMAWYDYATKKYTVFEGKYWLDNTIKYLDVDPITTDYMVLHYENPLVECENGFLCNECGEGLWCYKYEYPIDKPSGFNFKLNFKERNTISLYCLDAMFYTSDYDYIYKRKK